MYGKRARSGSIIRAGSAVATVSPAAMASLANRKAVKRLSTRVRKLEREEELKFLDTGLAFAVDSTGANEAELCLVAQGDGDSNRDGRQIVAKSIHARALCTFVPGASATASSSTMHLYIVQDRQCNGAAAGVSDVFTSTNLAVAFRNMGNIGRFKVWHHCIHTFTSAAGVSTAFANVTYAWDKYIKLNDVPILYDAAAAAIGSINSNNFFILAGTDGNSDDLITVSGAVRLTFTD